MDVNSVQSFLSNRTFLITIHQRSSGKSFFKDDAIPVKPKDSFMKGPARTRMSSLAVKQWNIVNTPYIAAILYQCSILANNSRNFKTST